MELKWDESEKQEKITKSLCTTLREYSSVLARIQELTERKKEIEHEVVSAHFPDAEKESGEWKRVIGDSIITVTRGERWKWDSTKLEEKFGLEPPEYIKRSYGCDKRKFEKLDAATQSAMLDALTKGLGVLSIDYEEVKG